ncbi:claudin-16-like [Microcaecilia unicolor]|uniref:Claudin-16-like n=1 Tax=Microcaecilia unicolor TaxID=1415580 RepID=A0A6P7ZXV1_9AMPH|nr:claudin-16-like [Microcaecilia unicolor]
MEESVVHFFDEDLSDQKVENVVAWDLEGETLRPREDPSGVHLWQPDHQGMLLSLVQRRDQLSAVTGHRKLPDTVGAASFTAASSSAFVIRISRHASLRMATTTAEVLGLLLGGICLVFFALASTTDCWREDAKDPFSSVGLSNRCRGLWSECVFDNMANLWTCDIPVSYLSKHPASLVVTRALMVVKGLLCLTAVPVLILGMKCTRFISNESHQKFRCSITAGILFLLGGLAGGVALLFYAVDTVQKYHLEVGLGVPGVTYELGYSYWFSMTGTICAAVAALLLLTVICSRNPTERVRKHPSAAQALTEKQRSTEGAGQTYL